MTRILYKRVKAHLRETGKVAQPKKA